MQSIPVNEPLLKGNEKKYLLECLESGWISSEGPFVGQFEKKFADYTGVQHGIAVCNGTAALEVALHALGIQPGDEIILPSFTMIACAIACIRVGANPVLVDIDPVTWTMDVSQIESKITKKTKAIMAVHIYGHPVNMDPLFKIRDEFGIPILEDAAEAHGAEYFSHYYGGRWLKCGSMGDIAATSFYANKIVTTGEGGMVLTNNPQYTDRARSFRNLYLGKEERFHHETVGYNFRMTNLQAAIGLAQCEQIDEFIAIKRKLAKCYENSFKNFKSLRFMQVMPWAKSVFWMYSVELSPSSGFTAKEMMEKLKEYGIGTRPFFKGMHAQPALKPYLPTNKTFPHTDHAYKYGFYLPSGLTLTEEQVNTVIQTLVSILNCP